MKITIARNEEEFDRIGAWRIIAQMLSKDRTVIGLSTGQTPQNMYRNIVSIFNACPFDVSSVTIFNVDQVTNISKADEASCYGMLKTQLTGHIGIAECNFIMPPEYSDNFTRDCEKFERELKRRGGVDLQFLGIGTNGHIGFNQPGSPFEGRAWISPLLPEFIARKRKQINAPEDLELGGFTLGIRTIMESRSILLAAKDSAKADIIGQALLGPVTPAIPASVLQLHPNCEVLLDADAAVKIIGRV